MNDGALPPQTATGVPMKRSSTHVVSLTGQEPSLQVPGGSMTHVDASVFPILERLSIRRLLLAPRGVREPHWHANCHELAYCVRGEALVTIFGNQSTRASFAIAAGEMFFVPSGALHHIESTGAAEAEFIIAFARAAGGLRAVGHVRRHDRRRARQYLRPAGERVFGAQALAGGHRDRPEDNPRDGKR